MLSSSGLILYERLSAVALSHNCAEGGLRQHCLIQFDYQQYVDSPHRNAGELKNMHFRENPIKKEKLVPVIVIVVKHHFLLVFSLISPGFNLSLIYLLSLLLYFHTLYLYYILYIAKNVEFLWLYPIRILRSVLLAYEGHILTLRAPS